MKTTLKQSRHAILACAILLWIATMVGSAQAKPKRAKKPPVAGPPAVARHFSVFRHFRPDGDPAKYNTFADVEAMRKTGVGDGLLRRENNCRFDITMNGTTGKT